MSDFSDKPFFSISAFNPKPGQLDDFMAAQQDGAARLGVIPGFVKSRFFRAEDASRAVLVTGFESLAAFQQLQASAGFQEQRARLMPYLEEAQTRLFRLVYQRN